MSQNRANAREYKLNAYTPAFVPKVDRIKLNFNAVSFVPNADAAPFRPTSTPLTSVTPAYVPSPRAPAFEPRSFKPNTLPYTPPFPKPSIGSSNSTSNGIPPFENYQTVSSPRPPQPAVSQSTHFQPPQSQSLPKLPAPSSQVATQSPAAQSSAPQLPPQLPPHPQPQLPILPSPISAQPQIPSRPLPSSRPQLPPPFIPQEERSLSNVSYSSQTTKEIPVAIQETKSFVREVKKPDVRPEYRNASRNDNTSRSTDQDSEKENPPSKTSEVDRVTTRPLFQPRTRIGSAGKSSKPVLGPGARLGPQLGISFARRPKPRPTPASVIIQSVVASVIDPTSEPEKMDIDEPVDTSKIVISRRGAYQDEVGTSDTPMKSQDAIYEASGNKVYQIEFMMKFEKLEHTQKKPDNIPDVQELIGTNSGAGGNRGKSPRNSGWRDAERRNQRGGNARRNQNMRGGNRNKRTENLTPVEPLTKSENRYKITKKADMEEDARKVRDINSILNKLTPEKFDTLVKRFQEEVPINDLKSLKEVVNCVFEKALSEASFCPTYATFCNTLSKANVGKNEQPFMENGQKQTFKRILLNQCQHEFESHAMSTDEEKSVRDAKKKRLLGTIRFIGELYIRKMATGRIIKECLSTLLGDYPHAKDLEALCKLLETCGKYIDGSDPRLLNSYFATLKQWSTDKSFDLDMRIRFKLKDVIELRQKKWKARIEKEEAKKLSEIHKQDKKEKQKARDIAAKGQRRGRNPRGMERDRYSSMRSSPTKKSRSGPSDNEWQSANSRGGPKKYPTRQERERTEESRSSRNSSRNYQKKEKSQKPTKRSKTDARPVANRFDALGVSSEDDDNNGSRSRRAPTPRLQSSRRDEPTPRRREPTPRSQEPTSQRREPTSQRQESTSRKPEKVLGRLIEPCAVIDNKEQAKSVDSAIAMLMKELFNCHDMDNAMMCVEDLPSQKHNYLLFSCAVKSITDSSKHDKAIELVLKLFKRLKKEGVITPQIITRGLVTLLKDIKEFSYDSPNVWKVGGQLLASLSMENMVSFTHFRTLKKEELKDVSKLILYGFAELAKHSESSAKKIFAESGIDLKSLCNPNRCTTKDIEDLLDRFKLKMLMQ